MENSFYRRALPASCIKFSSKDGKAIFKDSMIQNQCSMYLHLSEVFNKQSEPAFCGISTLCMILNCLSVDPTIIHGSRGIWRGPWRWYHEDLLDCCRPLPYILKNGISMRELQCLAQCNGLACTATCISDSSIALFRDIVVQLCGQLDPSEYLVVNYDRKALGQTGSGHFSPIAAYETSRDMVLLYDVAQFKYPPHWVLLTDMVEAMQSVDPQTGQSRGYMVMSKGAEDAAAVIFTLSDTVSLRQDAWDILRSWILLGADSDSEKLQLFVSNFRSNYTRDIAISCYIVLKESPMLNDCLYNIDAPFASSLLKLDPNWDHLLDRLSWIILSLAVEWARVINEEEMLRKLADDGNPFDSRRCCAPIYATASTVPSVVSIHLCGGSVPPVADPNVHYAAYGSVLNEIVSLVNKLVILIKDNDCSLSSSCCTQK